jgi:threonine synthase
MKQPLLFYSTNLKAEEIPFSMALLMGQAPDRGLYLPQSIPYRGFRPVELPLQG